MLLMENLSRKNVELSDSLIGDNLFGGFDMTLVKMGDDHHFEFNDYISIDGSKCILVLPKARFIDSPRCVWVILDKNHSVSLDMRKVSPWYTSSNGLRAVLLSSGDFNPERIKYDEKGFCNRGVNDDSDDCLTYEYWRSMVKRYSPRPWVNAYGWLFL